MDKLKIKSFKDSSSKDSLFNTEKNNLANEESIIKSIKDIIIEKNDWMEIKDIADILEVEKNKQLFESGHNSTIAQLINRYLKKQGIQSKKVNFDDGGYSIWVSSSKIPVSSLENILKTKYGSNYIIAEKTKANNIKPKPENNLQEAEESESTEDNEYLDKIVDLINKGENLFITGYAGTGKSYILNKLKKRFKIDVTSTTGLAAVNVQGQTIHSWAGVVFLI